MIRPALFSDFRWKLNRKERPSCSGDPSDDAQINPEEKCALGIRFPFELLDIFLGAWCAMMLPHDSENELLPDSSDASDAPEGARFLMVAIAAYQRAFPKDCRGDDDKALEILLKHVDADFVLRGVDESRRRTFNYRLRAAHLLLKACAVGRLDPKDWSLRRPHQMPARAWSPEQKAALDAIAAGLSSEDANDAPRDRQLLVTGGPGTGKTEVVIFAACAAAARGDRVLIACPVGALVDVYRTRLPAGEDIVIETVHASFRITRKADEQYVPPGRLRHFDLMILDEASQLDSHVWEQIRLACGVLQPGPYFVVVGDFQQLSGGQQLKDDLDHQVGAGALLRHIVLQQHEAARTSDPVLLAFLNWVRRHQPTRAQLSAFFGARRLSKNRRQAVQASREIEQNKQRPFTFLTVTNKAARDMNRLRLAVPGGRGEAGR